MRGNDGSGDEPVGLIAVAMARTVVAVVFAGFCLIALLFVASNPAAQAGDLVLAGCLLLGLLGLQLLYFSRTGARMGTALTYLLLAAQAALTYLPMPHFDKAWLGMPSLLAGTVLLVLPAVLAWPAFAAILITTSWFAWSLSHLPLDFAYTMVADLVGGLEVYGLTRLSWRISELHSARTELASAAVAHERLRFARDLHDLLGLSLSAIAPKGELAYRLVTRDPERARRELSEILDLARRALANARSVARGYRDLSLDEASRSAESVLSASMVDVRMELNHGELPPGIRTMLAVALREGVASVLRHGQAERCEIELRQEGDIVSLDIVSDGLEPASWQPGVSDDSELGRLADRVSGLGGRLTEGIDPSGRFRLHVSLPLTQRQRQRQPEPDEPVDQVPRSATQLARALVAAVFCGIALQTLLSWYYFVILVPGFQLSAVAVGCELAILTLQLSYFSRPGTRLRIPASYGLLALQAALVFLPLLVVGQRWIALPSFLAGTALLVLRPARAWMVFALIMGGVGWSISAVSPSLLGVIYRVTGSVISALVVYGLTEMVRTVSQLRAARRELADAAVAEERLRFARDLHDLLGLSLSAIALKSELANRLVTADPARARRELVEILSISRLALADVHSVASGERELSLVEESQSAHALLAAADVEVQLQLDYAGLPLQVETVLATVLREGVTNVLRHSSGEHCEITMQRDEGLVALDIVNDGVTMAGDASLTGSGIRNLASRVAAVGGDLSAGLDVDGRFRLRVTVPG